MADRDETDYFRGVTYVASFPDVKHCPDDGIPVIAVTGRSNAGKSSLLSAICDHKNLARKSKTAGKTKHLNYFSVPETRDGFPAFYLVDMPGFGYASASEKERMAMGQMISGFVSDSPYLQLLIIVVDARRDLTETEVNLIDFCGHNGVPFLLARTKWDTMNTKEKNAARGAWKKMGILPYSVVVSSTKKIGLDIIIQNIRERIKNT